MSLRIALSLLLATTLASHAADAPKWKKLNPQTPAGFTLKTIEPGYRS